MGKVHGARLRNLLGSLAVLAVAAGVAVGLPAIDRALPAARTPPAGQPYAVGGGVRLVPPAGAVLDVTGTRPGPVRGTVLFLLGPVRYVVVVAPFAGSLVAAADRLRDKITATRGYQVTGPRRDVATGGGLVGLGGGYAAPGRQGRYSVFLVNDVAIEVTVSGTDADLRATLDAIEASIESLTYRRAPG